MYSALSNAGGDGKLYTDSLFIFSRGQPEMVLFSFISCLLYTFMWLKLFINISLFATASKQKENSF